MQLTAILIAAGIVLLPVLISLNLAGELTWYNICHFISRKQWPPAMERRKEARVLEKAKERAESKEAWRVLESRVRNYRREKQNKQEQLMREWTRDFAQLLPPEEHPDYVKPSSEDFEGDWFTTKTWDGSLMQSWGQYATKDGKYYTVYMHQNPLRFILVRGQYNRDITEEWIGLHPDAIEKGL